MFQRPGTGAGRGGGVSSYLDPFGQTEKWVGRGAKIGHFSWVS